METHVTQDNPAFNSRLMRALRREPVKCTPIWLTRQEGGYLHEHRATRGQGGRVLPMATTPEPDVAVHREELHGYTGGVAARVSELLHRR